MTTVTGCHALPEREIQRLSWRQGPSNPFMSVTSTSGPSQLLRLQGKSGSQGRRMGACGAAVLRGPPCRFTLDPRAMAQRQASRWGTCRWLPSPWSPSFSSPLHPWGGLRKPSWTGAWRSHRGRLCPRLVSAQETTGVSRRGSPISRGQLKTRTNAGAQLYTSRGRRGGGRAAPEVIGHARNGHSLNERPGEPGWGSRWPGFSLSLCEVPTTLGSICCPRCRERTAFQGIPDCMWL